MLSKQYEMCSVAISVATLQARCILCAAAALPAEQAHVFFKKKVIYENCFKNHIFKKTKSDDFCR